VIFIDTGAFMARYIARDQHHSKASRAWKRLEKEKEGLATSSFVLDETLTLLARRTSYAFAALRGEAIFASRVLAILRPDPADEVAALTLFKKLADQEVSFTDCVSFALMRRHRITRAFTFDRHFEAAGFTVWPN
jgi:predicted nucleic acid-binding protein